mmetsp:Transcript_19766/g.47753  ORF Transcript_19766/g.47753 Transcript_19766/m.47753 type:complete len:100 (-) Transcript_19766:48-347(-)
MCSSSRSSNRRYSSSRSNRRQPRRRVAALHTLRSAPLLLVLLWFFHLTNSHFLPILTSSTILHTWPLVTYKITTIQRCWCFRSIDLGFRLVGMSNVVAV